MSQIEALGRLTQEIQFKLLPLEVVITLRDLLAEYKQSVDGRELSPQQQEAVMCGLFQARAQSSATDHDVFIQYGIEALTPEFWIQQSADLVRGGWSEAEASRLIRAVQQAIRTDLSAPKETAA